MDIQFFKTAWGRKGSYLDLAKAAKADGFDGIELPIPPQKETQEEIRSVLNAYGMPFIAEICTAGSYVPSRGASVREHVDSFRLLLDAALFLGPLQVTAIAGCDAWPLAQSVECLGRMNEIAKESGVPTTFETHRGRSFFTPWVTKDILEQLPDLYLTCDFSHWCVVCERLIDTEEDAMELVFSRARHIHARVGYDQGPQVPHPAAPEFSNELRAHQRWWERCWQAMQKNGMSSVTMTPEFGPDGYLHRLPFTNAPVADLDQVNAWMLKTEHAHFSNWMSAGRPD